MAKTTKINFPKHNLDYDITEYVREPLAIFLKSLITSFIMCEIVSVTIVVSLPNITLLNIIGVTQLSLTLALVYATYRTISYLTKIGDDKSTKQSSSTEKK